MAGIQFELKKAFNRKGLFSLIAGYGYASVISAGPTILGFVFLLGIRAVGALAGAGEYEIKVLNAMVTITLLASLAASNVLGLVTTRYTADQIYAEQMDKVMPSLIGSVSLTLLCGVPLFGIIMAFSGLDILDIVLCMIMFSELVLVWAEINYLTAIKDYQGIMLAYAVSIGASLSVAFLFAAFWHFLPLVDVLLLAIVIAYGIMAVWFYSLLSSYFPTGGCSTMSFLAWISRYPQLVWIGVCDTVGLFGHIVLMWFSPAGNYVVGILKEAPIYDIPALVAFLSTLPTTVNFVTSVEACFYPEYRSYFSLLNHGGSLLDIELAGKQMKQTLMRELSSTFMRQFFASLLFIIGGTLLLPALPLGFSDEMLGIYRVLCCAYGFYAMGNTLMLIQLYFADNKGALISMAVFVISSVIGTLGFRYRIHAFGFGFLIAGILFTIVSMALLADFMKNILENVLSRSTIKPQEVHGLNLKLAEYFESRFNRKHMLESPADEE